MEMDTRPVVVVTQEEPTPVVLVEDQAPTYTAQVLAIQACMAQVLAATAQV